MNENDVKVMGERECGKLVVTSVDPALSTINEFELVDHGIQHEQYFQGCGVAFTDYLDCVTGIGDNPSQAIDDCLEQLACMGWETDAMGTRIIAQEFKPRRKMPITPKVLKRHGDEAHYYISIRVK